MPVPEVAVRLQLLFPQEWAVVLSTVTTPGLKLVVPVTLLLSATGVSCWITVQLAASAEVHFANSYSTCEVASADTALAPDVSVCRWTATW